MQVFRRLHEHEGSLCNDLCQLDVVHAASRRHCAETQASRSVQVMAAARIGVSQPAAY